MSRPSILILLGVLAILTPFSGLPQGLRAVLFVVFGACVFGFGLSERLREQRRVIAAAPPPLPAVGPEPAMPEPPVASAVSPI